MKKSSFTAKQVTYASRQAESGMPVADVCRQLGLTELRQRRDENARLKRVVVDLTLDKHVLGEEVRKKLCSRPGAVRWSAGSRSGSG